MKLIERVGDLFDYPGLAIGHGVNTQGVMGAGVAREFRDRYPEMFDTYRDLCRQGKLSPGEAMLYEVSASRVVCNLATQRFLGANALVSWVIDAVKDAATSLIEHYHCYELATCRIGCGIGGLEWEAVREYLDYLNLPEFTLVVYSLEEQ